eukprot:TRINITY_DN3225_c0_g4_i1.p1 TRINITY_DN3225_c0_g4~~TRINITY_DN3225_c0_g4_i1.p1  ORF type:complete len:482 (-),score=26.68 TRINITY_DN3225_c0_g4_i1:848-2293(-)
MKVQQILLVFAFENLCMNVNGLQRYVTLDKVDIRKRQLLQSYDNAEILRLATQSCDPSLYDCSQIVSEDCTDVLPEEADFDCPQYARMDLCSILEDDYCRKSCNKCQTCTNSCEDVLLPGIPDCNALVQNGQCNLEGIAGVYCVKSCGGCQGGSVDTGLGDWYPVYQNLSATTPQRLANEQDSILDDTTGIGDCSQAWELGCDLEALTSFRNTVTQGSSYFDSWNGEDPCIWDFVTCERIEGSSKRVTKLDMDFYNEEVYNIFDHNRISMQLVPDLSKLRYAREIFMSNQNIRGTLPLEYSVLNKLSEFAIWRTDLTGSFPPHYSEWKDLQHYGVGFNIMSGPIPVEYSVWTQVYRVSIGANEGLQGSISPEFSVWTQITRFDFALNQLTGTLPAGFSQWVLCCDYFGVFSNELVGTLPPGYSEMTRMEDFSAMDNDLTGTLPKQYSTWRDLERFTSSDNFITSDLPNEWSTFRFTAVIDL